MVSLGHNKLAWNLMKFRLPITYGSVVKPFWHFVPGSDTAVLCAKSQNVWVTDEWIMGKRDITRFEFNPLGPNDAMWRWRSWSTLVQVMVCCLTAPSHYLNQCWLIISKVLWHSSQHIIVRRFEDTNQKSKIEDYIFKITLRSPRG